MQTLLINLQEAFLVKAGMIQIPVLLLENLNWYQILMPETPFLEIVVRGTAVYLSLFIILRVVLKRESGTLGITDLLVVVLLADAAQNAMSDDYSSIADGLILVATIVFWSYFLNWLGYKFSWFQKLIKPPKLLLIKNGKMLRRHMKEELVTKDELMSEIRANGLTSIEDVEEAYMEHNGRISIITKNGIQNQPSADERVF
jgi:uncharacterized membrane protein YcaP (DUF421 family)